VNAIGQPPGWVLESASRNDEGLRHRRPVRNKDFVDLHEIVSAGLFSIDELMSLFEKKPRRRLTPERLRHFRRSLTDFKLAEPTLMPRLSGPAAWQPRGNEPAG
jgi:hypothetical protein